MGEFDSGSDSEATAEPEQAALDSMHSAPPRAAPQTTPAADPGSSGEHQTVAQSLQAAAPQAQAPLKRPTWLGSAPFLPWPLPPLNKISSWNPQPPFTHEYTDAPSQLKDAAAQLIQKMLFLLCDGTRVSLRHILDDAEQVLEEATAGHSRLMAMVPMNDGPNDSFDPACPATRFYLNNALGRVTHALKILAS